MFSLFRDTARRLRAFRDDTRGSLTVEAAILIPALFWAFGTTFVFFDAFRQNGINQKAAFTIGDMLSRETNVITPEYLDNTRNLLELLTGMDSADLAVRVSMIRFDADANDHVLRWSQTRGGVLPLENSDISDWENVLPIMVDEEQIIVVETFADWRPVFDIGFGETQFASFVFTRPRFAPQLHWMDTSDP
jgi:hypothetical protein